MIRSRTRSGTPGRPTPRRRRSSASLALATGGSFKIRWTVRCETRNCAAISLVECPASRRARTACRSSILSILLWPPLHEDVGGRPKRRLQMPQDATEFREDRRQSLENPQQVGGTGGDPPIQLREVRHEIPSQEVTPVRREERPEPEVQGDLLHGGLIGLTLPLVAVGDILRQPEDQSPVLPLGDLDRVPEGAPPLKGIAVRQERHLDPPSSLCRHEAQPEREGPGRPRLLDLHTPD